MDMAMNENNTGVVLGHFIDAQKSLNKGMSALKALGLSVQPSNAAAVRAAVESAAVPVMEKVRKKKNTPGISEADATGILGKKGTTKSYGILNAFVEVRMIQPIKYRSRSRTGRKRYDRTQVEAVRDMYPGGKYPMEQLEKGVYRCTLELSENEAAKRARMSPLTLRKRIPYREVGNRKKYLLVDVCHLMEQAGE